MVLKKARVFVQEKIVSYWEKKADAYKKKECRGNMLSGHSTEKTVRYFRYMKKATEARVILSTLKGGKQYGA